MVSKNLYEFLFKSGNLPQELRDENLHQQLLSQLNQYVKITKYRHRMLVQQAGMVPDRLYFVESGIVRGYTDSPEQEKEKTVAIWLDNALLVDANSFIHEMESNVFIEVMPETELSYISRHHLKEIMQCFPFAQGFVTCLIQNNIKYSNTRLFDKSANAWDRLLEMRKLYPRLEQMVSREMIASFLNITPQHLSKIVRDNRLN